MFVASAQNTAAEWLCLIMSLPTQHATGRMRVWRALKALGCGALRDGVYLLPALDHLQPVLEAQAEAIRAGGGVAHVLRLVGTHPSQQQGFESLFDRSGAYARLQESIRESGDLVRSEDRAKLQGRVGRLRKQFVEIAAVDFFPGAAREQAGLALDELERAMQARMSPDEPQAISQAIKRLNRQDYHSQRWATRKRPWIDRLASAWLIRRFIDPSARFLWLTAPADCPPEVLGFDFDGAAFTHVGAKGTFEVLLASFGLTADKGLERLAALVHYLDVGGIPVAEAPGLAALIRGMQQRLDDDDQLLAEAETVFDSFYLDFTGLDT
jgi:hypothetical protein